MLFLTNDKGEFFVAWSRLFFNDPSRYAVWFGGSLLASLVSCDWLTTPTWTDNHIELNSPSFTPRVTPKLSTTKLVLVSADVIRYLAVLPDRKRTSAVKLRNCYIFRRKPTGVLFIVLDRIGVEENARFLTPSQTASSTSMHQHRWVWFNMHNIIESAEMCIPQATAWLTQSAVFSVDRKKNNFDKLIYCWLSGCAITFTHSFHELWNRLWIDPGYTRNKGELWDQRLNVSLIFTSILA